MQWLNPQSEPFKIYGFPFYEKDKVYRRMPLSPAYPLPEAVDALANETAGGQIRFRAKMKKLVLEVNSMSKPGYFDHVSSPHTAEVMKHSFDLYLSKDGKDFVFYDVSKNMTQNNHYYTRELVDLEETEEFDVLLNFPAYGGVDKVLIGLDDEAEISAPRHNFVDNKKLILYGSSIQQGASAGRPGMTMSSLLSRWINREVYNLGFNSSGKAEAEVAHVIAGIAHPAALVISVEGNCPSSEWLDEKLRQFVAIYREKHPHVPIIILPFIISGKDYLTPSLLERRRRDRAIQKRIVADRRASGDKHLYVFTPDEETTKTKSGHSVWHEMTVDGLHYNDFGFYEITAGLYKFLKEKAGL